MKVTEKFALQTCVPANPLYSTSANSSTPTRLASQPTAAGNLNRRLLWCSCNRGFCHRVESATKDTTSTIAAVQLNSHTGIGRSARPTMPWACALAGFSNAVTPTTPSTGASNRRRDLI